MVAKNKKAPKKKLTKREQLLQMPKEQIVDRERTYHGIAMATTVTLYIVFTYAAYILANYNILLQIKH